MVHEKKKSGDPDFDDKVPAGDHLTVVTAGDGKVVGRMDPALGPVTLEGAHLAEVPAEDLDTRPAPGEVAEEKAEVQTYTAEDTPHEEISLEEAHAPAPAEDDKPAEPTPAPAEQEPKPTPAPAPAKSTPAKSGPTANRPGK
jgi:hypothetical protein